MAVIYKQTTNLMTKKLALLPLIFLAISCKTYTIAPENFKKQFISDNANNLKDVEVNNPIFKYAAIKYQANTLKYLNVYDKKGKLEFIQNSPSVEIRVTLKDGTRKNLYLDTVTLENDTLKGEKSRILHLKSKIPFEQIAKIEVQEAGKKYEYK